MLEEDMMNRRILMFLGVLALATYAWAVAPESGNAVSATQASALVTFANTHRSVFIANDGTTDYVTIRVWQESETPTAITTTTNGAIRLPPGAAITYGWDDSAEIGIGYKGFSHICDTGKTATVRWLAK
jgi:lipopolysaccharide export system protein LptC